MGNQLEQRKDRILKLYFPYCMCPLSMYTGKSMALRTEPQVRYSFVTCHQARPVPNPDSYPVIRSVFPTDPKDTQAPPNHAH